MAVRKVEEEIESLQRLRDVSPVEAAGPLRKALADRVNLVVAKAAALAAEMRLRDLLPDLLRAFERLFDDPVKRDPQCWAKNAIAQALVGLEYRESAPFVRGSRHIQMEPVWGGEEDTALTLRGACVLALVACNDLPREQVMRHLVDALTGPAHRVRLEAVRALAQMEGEDSALVLRVKARVGDERPEVVGQVFDALLALEREQALPFVEEFLNSGAEEARHEAALSLGSSRLPGSLDRLEQAWIRARDSAFRLAVLRGMSASRHERAIAFLLDLVRQETHGEAALEALAIHRDFPEIAGRVEDAANHAGPAVQRHFRRLFGASKAKLCERA